MEFKYDVFISYSSKDYLDDKGKEIPGNVISVIKNLFDKQGVTYWIDQKESMTGKRLTHIVAKRIRESKVFLLVCSKNSVESQWVPNELDVAAVHGKKIVPLVCDDSYKDDRVIMYTARKGCCLYSENRQVALEKLLKSVNAALTIVGHHEELQKVQQDEHWGFADISGEIVIPCIYNDVTYFQEGLACVESDKRKWGFVDEKGNEVIPCKWEDVGFFSEGLAYAEDSFGRIGFIDKKGKVVIPCQWEDAAPFLNGKAFVKDKEGAWHQIDKEGNFI